MKILKSIVLSALLATSGLSALSLATVAQAATREDLNKDSNQALANLYKQNPAAKAIGNKAKAILVFPNIVKAGLVFGGAYGEGELINNGKVEGYYNSVTGSWGLQAGAQSYGYVVFLMNKKALDYIDHSDGWEIGVGPTIVLVDQGMSENLSTTTLKDDAYAFIFNQQGLMAGVSLEGTKISRIKQ
jgi:lipid-binding SYLF domain-containing protein